MTGRSDLQWNNEEIADHLKSAIDSLTPNVLDEIDLTAPQEFYSERGRTVRLYRRMRTVALAAAACLFVAVLGGGVAKFQNSRVESIVGIDVNPSVELSVNRNDKVLRAEPLNEDAVEVLDEMDLKGVDLDIAVNAVIGSMVRHGYLDDLDNAILVTVANDDKSKAAALRQNVVVDIESSLEEHKVNAVVYDQQASLTDDVKALAKQYGISYGKAYFLQELVDENNLSDGDMDSFAGMTMEEIAREITERSYHVRTGDEEDSPETSSQTEHRTERETDTTAEPPTKAETAPETVTEESTQMSTEETATAPPATEPSKTQTAATESTPEETQETSTGGRKAVVNNADFEDGYLNIEFKEKVKWKNPTISVTGEGGSYSARITDTSSESCEIRIEGLEGGQEYVYVLGGVAPREGGSYSSIKGKFDAPDIADEIGGGDGDDGDGETPEESETSTEATQPTETAAPATTAAEPQTAPSTEAVTTASETAVSEPEGTSAEPSQ